MNAIWIFLTTLIFVAAIIISLIVGVIIGSASTINRMNDELKKLADEYKDTVKNNSDFFKNFADALNDLPNKG